MSHEHTISYEDLSGHSYEFALLHNRLLEAGYSTSTAIEVATQICSEGLKIKCECKHK